ncbi:MAG: EAL domain-containing protein [Cyanobacteria bacterium]|nr:EAL domain-containing protein [Cyanobacteria bacterium CG_2015-16_32_12]NCO77676.1 EAL domain-containing protein [Cyanobacteria bacterium CG_2015-22_32_23]NCQ05156.1 EAL domain-containing protein [Cyanobacteria bacterium CG_2015-09_32_10]NCQ41137.1 EAL domain-containing protein [Cyanobacteria bacterium CG_2015-04_32_10]NCS83657.1 EAL domain-containing protein [Cyanobacteria bacterium CG_2015-02_32_10]
MDLMVKDKKGVRILNEKKSSYVIYAVDDQRINLDLITVFLRNKGFKVFTETDIIKAIKEIDTIKPDLILLDVLMPDLSGFDACNLLKSFPRTKDIPIIFLTSLDETADKVKGLELGAVDYLTKPVQFSELLSRINSCLKISQLTKHLREKNNLLVKEIYKRKKAQLALKNSEDRLKTIINNNLNGMIVIDYEGKILFLNSEAEKLFNREKNQMLGEILGIPLEFDTITELEIPRFYEELITVEMRAVPIIWNDNNAFLISFFDITERKKMEEKLKILFQASEQSPASIIITDIEGNIEYVNPKFEAVSGYKEEEIIGKNPRILKSGYTSDNDYKNLWETLKKGKEWQGEFHNIKKNGELYWEKALISPIFNSAGVITHYMAVKEDITEKKQQDILLQYQAKYDHLTKIPNRNYALEKVNYLLNQARETQSNLGLMFLDLDHFKEVNDSLGHDFGDELLIQATERMKKALRNTDLLARLGGDEFLIAIPCIEKFSDLEVITKKIIDLLNLPFDIFNHQVFVSASIGITVFPHDGNNLKQLIRNADLAMYEAKKNGRNQSKFYQYQMSKIEINKTNIEKNFHEALANNEFKILYQPVVELKTQLINSAEALIRWENKDLGLIYPEKFIPLFENNSLIFTLENWLLKSVIEDIKTWKEIKNIPISLNLSEFEFEDQNIMNKLINSIPNNQLKNNNIQIEIKEDMLLERKHLLNSIFKDISALNIELCLDNFGIGFSSLTNLHKFSFNSLKIDQSLIHNLEKDKKAQKLVKSIIAAAKVLNIKTIAKGIEVKEQLDILNELECNYGQGYFFSQPLSAVNFVQYILKQQK